MPSRHTVLALDVKRGVMPGQPGAYLEVSVTGAMSHEAAPESARISELICAHDGLTVSLKYQ